MRKICTAAALAALIFAQLACLLTETAIRKEEGATATALTGQTATADALALAQGTVITPTPKCSGLFGCRPTRTPRPPTPTKTPLPTPTRVVGIRTVTTKGSSRTYHEYYKDPSDSRKLGVISGGMQLTVVSEIHDGRYLQVFLEGTMEVNDLGFKGGEYPQNYKGHMGETSCTKHSWKHIGNKELCHAHFWCGDEVCATIPDKLDYVIDSEFAVNQRVQVRIIQLVWINGSSVSP